MNIKYNYTYSCPERSWFWKTIDHFLQLLLPLTLCRIPLVTTVVVAMYSSTYSYLLLCLGH